MSLTTFSASLTVEQIDELTNLGVFMLDTWTKNGALNRAINDLNKPICDHNLLINQERPIPLDQKSLINTVGQIFSMRGDLRNALITFANNNTELAQKESNYIDEQINIICSSEIRIPNKGNKSTFVRDITHRKKLVQVSVQLYRNTVFNEGKIVTDKIEWCIVGDHLQEVFRFLPRIKQLSGKCLPTTGSNHSKWYSLDKDNKNLIMKMLKRISLELRMLQLYILSSNTRVENRVMHEAKSDVISSGILDLDIKVDYKTLELLKEKKGIDLISHTSQFMFNRGNPCKEKETVYIYNKNGTTSSVLNEIFKIAPIPNVYPNHIWLDPSLSNKTEFQSLITDMIVSDCSIALMSINKHSLFWVKHDNVWYLCDPWKKKFFPGPRHEQYCRDTFNELIGNENNENNENNDNTDNCKTHWTFLPRKYEEQHSSEGSCSVASLSRVLQLSVLLQLMDKNPTFDELANLLISPIEDWSAMLASSLVRLGIFYVSNLQKDTKKKI